MTTLETLHLRMAGDDLDEIVDQVRKATGYPGGSPFVSIYRHSKVQGDLLVQVVSDDPNREAVTSELGIGLAALLRTHGLVEHSVWVSPAVPAEGDPALVQKENRQ
ncbi:MAG: hypothetical protein HKO65_00060 [Gemmatimonadetes bacterium]|nr:hypothetical protein [Gemmatimonadota bacterium]NNM03466.1 hypothetical protein [Gemmatimonadota bacterium]